MRTQYKNGLLTGAVAIEMCFGFKAPLSMHKLYGQKAIGRKYTKRPDLDNLEKFYLDCLTGVVFPDDAQVTSLHSKKEYASKDYTEIFIYELA